MTLPFFSAANFDAARYRRRLWQLGLAVALLIFALSGIVDRTGLSAALPLIIALAIITLIVGSEWRNYRSIRRAYDMAMLAAHDGFWEWNPLTKRLRVGTRLLEILGYREDFLPDTHAWLRLVHPDDVDTYNHAVSDHLKGLNDYFYCEYRVRASDNTYRWIASRGIAVRDRHGRAYQMVGSVSDITDRRQHIEEMEFLAQHDMLTGLPNRLLFAEHLQVAMSSAELTKGKAAILFIDLDRFKNINDTLGHRAGDQLLQLVTHRLQTEIPANCRLYRQGGDEFIVLMHPLTDAEEALEAAGRLRERINAPFEGGQSDFFTGASIGISLYPDDAGDGETLLRHADAAMYEAKSAGGNAIRMHSALMDRRLSDRVHLENRLRHAIDKGALSLHYQPQMDTGSGDIVGAEALLRWQDQGKFISPAEFIPIAEDSGLIMSIGDWVIDEAVRQIAAWRTTYQRVPPIAINLSARQFWRPGLAERLQQALQSHGLPTSALEVEVTESVMLDPEGNSLAELQRIDAAGIHLALDDFGTGYSSLSYLQRLPVRTLKIDRSFTQQLDDRGAACNESLVKAMIAMARSLSLRVVAEGVETDEQHRRLYTMSCDVIQGYLFSPPLPPDTFAERYLQRRY